MKNKILIFVLLLIFPFIINAAEKCKVISGNLTKLGSEITCGDEHFYLVESNEGTVKLMAKYNLDIGKVYEKFILSDSRYNEILTDCGGSNIWCEHFYNSPEYKAAYANIDGDNISLYGISQHPMTNDDGETEHYFLIEADINFTEMKQSSKAIGAHGDERGKPEFPEYGVIDLIPAYSDIDAFNQAAYYNGKMSDYDFEEVPIISNGDDDLTYLKEYKTYLESKGYNVNSVDVFSFNDINKLVLSLSGNEIPVDEWYSKPWGSNLPYEFLSLDYLIIGSIKDLIPEGNEWLYSTTYWLKTATSVFTLDENGDEVQYDLDPANLMFMDTLGNLCVQDVCSSALGAGIRPVVEMNKDDIIIYNITVETDGNGTIEVEPTAPEGETIIYVPKPNDGYELEDIYIVTESGDRTDLEKDDITCSEEEKCIINPDKFKMPDEDIVIHVKWINNPKTGVRSIFMVIYAVLLASICGYFVLKNNHISL